MITNLCSQREFNLPDICWKYRTAEREQCIEDNFLTQLMRERIKEGTLLGLLSSKRELIVDDVMIWGHFEHSDHDVMEFSVVELKKGGNRTVTLEFQWADWCVSEGG